MTTEQADERNSVSDMEMPLEGAEAEIGPEEIGETESEAEVVETIEEPQYDFLELDDELGSKYVKLTIDGEEKPVSLKEALDGYNSNAAATKRFQEAAELRKQADEALRLQQAFQTSPGLTVQVLASQAGMSVEEFLGLTPAQQQQAVQDAEPEYDDPLEKALAEERQARLALEQRIEAREADERLQRAVYGLKQQFNATDDQARATVQRAYQMGLGIEALPLVYKAMAYEASQQVTAQQTAAQEAEAARKRQAAAAASQAISTGSGAAGTTEQRPAGTYSSIREAAAAAFDEVEGRGVR